MSGRRDYYHDPTAPQANSIVPGGSALVTDETGRVLLQRRADSGRTTPDKKGQVDAMTI